MLFCFSTTVLFTLALVQLVVGQPTLGPTQLVTNINEVTAIFSQVNSALALLDTNADALHAQGSANNLVSDLLGLSQTISGDAIAITPIAESDVSQVAMAVRGVLRGQQTLMETINEKHPIFAQFNLTDGIAEVIDLLKTTAGVLGGLVTSLLPHELDGLQPAAGRLEQTLETSMNTYSQICIPSPEYPTRMPLCQSA